MARYAVDNYGVLSRELSGKGWTACGSPEKHSAGTKSGKEE